MSGDTSLLLQAARSGDVDVIKQLMEKGNSLDETDEQGRSALHHAVEANQHGSLRLLLEADPGLATLQDSDGRNVLHLSTVAGEVELIKELVKYVDVDAVDNEKHTAVHFATVSGLYNCIELLIEHGADPGTPDIHGAYPVHYAAQMCGEPKTAVTGIKCLQSLLSKGGSHVNCKDEGGKSPLLWASSAGSSKACKLLVDHGADINLADNDGLTAVHCATSRNKSRCLKTLLDECNCKVDQTDNNGCTPLFYAIMMDYHRCVKILLKHGASPSWQDLNGKSPVHCAAAKGSVRYLKMLKKSKGRLELPTSSGERPIHEAARAGNNDAVQFLLKRGVGVNVRNNDGLTALHIAAETDNLPLCKELVNKGADITAVYNSSKSNQTTAGVLAKEKGCQSCAEYLQYVQDHGIQPERRTHDSSSSNDDVSSSSSSEDEKDEEEDGNDEEESDKKDVETNGDDEMKEKDEIQDNDHGIIDDGVDNRNALEDQEKKEQSTPDNLDKREDSFDNQKDNKDDSDREIMMRSPNMNNNNSPDMSSVEDEKRPSNDSASGPQSAAEPIIEDNAVEKGNDAQERKSSGKTESNPEQRPASNREKEPADEPQNHERTNPEERNETPATSNQEAKDEGETKDRKDHEEMGDRPSSSASWDPEKFQKKIADWDGYLKGNMEFLDTIIGSKAPELEEIRADAKSEMKTMVEKLETLKKEVDDRCKQLVNKMSDREGQRKHEYEALMKKWKESEARFKKSQDRIDSAVSDYRTKNQELEARLNSTDTTHSRSTSSQGSRGSAGKDRAQRRPKSQASHSDMEKERKRQHRAWLREREAEYLRKKQEVRLGLVFEHTVQSLRAKRALMAHVSMSRNSGKIPPRSPLSPRLSKSPFSQRTVDQCPVLKKSQTSGPSAEDNNLSLTSYDKAQLRRSIGDRINQRMYPKSWEMATEGQRAQDSDGYIPKWDGGVRPKHRLEFVPRTPQHKHNTQDNR
ncbi:uncharacterized protein [Amphiura filiformis]|uniref:uncharacterized protein n=1 Tax=Amphiura filiformis TaxID=82378 RepID=UPI003B22363D